MSAFRTLFRKYWIILIILLWVIAWVNRDWLAGVGAHTETTVEEPLPVAAQEADEPKPAVAQALGRAAAGNDVRVDDARDSAQAVSAKEAAVATVVGEAPMKESPVTAPEVPAVSSERDHPVKAVAAESAPTVEVGEGPASVEPLVSVDEHAEPRPAAPPEPAVSKMANEQAEAVRPAQLLSLARDANRSRGPRAAAQILSEGLGKLPADAVERADLLGELGNFRFAGGDLRGAFQAYEQALMALPQEERPEMVERLGPVYDRFHPEGRSRLAQFR